MGACVRVCVCVYRGTSIHACMIHIYTHIYLSYPSHSSPLSFCVYLSVCMSTCMSTCLSVCLDVCLSVYTKTIHTRMYQTYFIYSSCFLYSKFQPFPNLSIIHPYTHRSDPFICIHRFRWYPPLPPDQLPGSVLSFMHSLSLFYQFFAFVCTFVCPLLPNPDRIGAPCILVSLHPESYCPQFCTRSRFHVSSYRAALERDLPAAGCL